jgi:hypothetical protein
MPYEIDGATSELIEGYVEDAGILINGMVTEQWQTTFANPDNAAYLGAALIEGVEIALEKIGKVKLTAPQKVELDPAIDKYLEARGGKYITWLSNSGKNDFKRLLVKSYRENGTLSGFQKVFKEEYPQMQRWKALQIWQTESNLAVNNAQFSAYEQLEDVIGFRNILGNNPCPICRYQASYDHKINEERGPYHVSCVCIPEPIIKGVHKFSTKKSDPTNFMDQNIYDRLNKNYKEFGKESVLPVALPSLF